nr:hypothetical protein [Tanacetum cinerariifolium]
MCELACQIFQKKQEQKRIEEEQAAKARYWKIPACCDDDDDDDSAITPILSTKEAVDSLTKDHVEIVINSNDDISSSDGDSLHEENIEYVEASPYDSELVSLEAVEIVILEVEEIKDDNLHKKLLNVHLLIANIEALKDTPTQSSELLTKSSSTSLNSFLEETNTFHNSLLEFENFDLGEIKFSSGSPTTHSDISLSEYDSFIFDLAHEEFVDELAHIISPPEYDCFYFRDLPDQGELMSVLYSGIRENLSITRVNLPIEDDHSLLLAYVVWIFVAYLTYPVIPPYLYQFGNENTIFDPGITINHFYSFEPVSSHRHGAFKKFNTHRSHLNEWLMIINGKNTPILDVLIIPENLKTLAKGFYPPSLKFLSFNWESEIQSFGYFRDIGASKRGVKFCAGEGGEGSGRRGEVVELGWNGGSWWEKCWRENRVKENQENDKIGSKRDKNGKRGEAGKSLKQLQLKEEEKPKKTKKEWPKTHT